MKLLFVALTILCVAISCSADNILAVLPTPFRSHYIQVEPILHALAHRGHNVTVLSPFPPKKPTPNFKHTFYPADKWKEFCAKMNRIEIWSTHSILLLPFFKKYSHLVVTEVFNSTVFQALIRAENEFDLIFTEVFFRQEALVVLGHIFNAPVVTYSPFGYAPDILRYAGAANAFSYLPYKMELDYAGPMNLVQRLHNALIQSATMIFNEYWNYPSQDALISQYIPGAHPRVSDMLRNISLFFLTANIAFDGAKLYPPNFVEISGLHFKELSALDEELRTIMDKATKGVMYISLGSLMDWNEFQKEDILTFLTVFRQLDQTVLWKTNLNVSHLDIPENVHAREWFDQNSILAHPNCVLFLTHGGLSSTMEAIRHAVPMIGMPIFGDQTSNVANAEYYGYGVRLLLNNLTQASLSWAIDTVTRHPRFKENISRASRILADKPMSSLETAVYWIEYVIRHKGAHHLKPLAAHIPCYQLFLLDVIAILTATIVVLIYLTTKLIFILCRKFGKKSSLSKDKTS